MHDCIFMCYSQSLNDNGTFYFGILHCNISCCLKMRYQETWHDNLQAVALFFDLISLSGALLLYNRTVFLFTASYLNFNFRETKSHPTGSCSLSSASLGRGVGVIFSSLGNILLSALLFPGATLSMRPAPVPVEEPEWRQTPPPVTATSGTFRLRRGSRFTWRKECLAVMER